jgi:hypothetical protein
VSGPTQTDRVVKAARSFRGICRVDFQLPDVIDGGSPILNFPGRMFDAERLGHNFEIIGKRHGCKVWRLISDPDEQTVPSPSSCASPSADEPDESTLFTPAPTSRPHWDEAA